MPPSTNTGLYLSALSVTRRNDVINRASPYAETFHPSSITTRATLWSHALITSVLHRRIVSPPPQGPQHPHTINPSAVNNAAVFVVFGLLFASLVIATIWFFFWAKNGGFIFRPTDWEDYKSSVLRRKDRDGKAWSNATKSTKLGGRSLGTNSFMDEESMLGSPAQHAGPKRSSHNNQVTSPTRGKDQDMRAYRAERPARVGGLNRKSDGWVSDAYTDTERSLVAATPPKSKRNPKASHKAPEMTQNKPARASKRSFFHRTTTTSVPKHTPSSKHQHQPRRPSNAYSFTANDEDAYTELSSVPEHSHTTPTSRRTPQQYGAATTNTTTRNGTHRAIPQHSPTASPRAHTTSRRHQHSHSHSTDDSVVDDNDNDEDEGDLGRAGTKAYRHVIPGLSPAPRAQPATQRGEAASSAGKSMTESSFERGERRGKEGYRRGDRGAHHRSRRDSLSDSE